MIFTDFPYPEHLKSYIAQEDVLKYINDFADHYNLRPHIKVRYNYLIFHLMNPF